MKSKDFKKEFQEEVVNLHSIELNTKMLKEREAAASIAPVNAEVVSSTSSEKKVKLSNLLPFDAAKHALQPRRITAAPVRELDFEDERRQRLMTLKLSITSEGAAELYHVTIVLQYFSR
jgi:hypothetical protein